MNKNYLKNLLSTSLDQIPNTWQFNDKESIFENLLKLENFLQMELTKKHPLSILTCEVKDQIQYQSSIFHFILYYMPNPNHSFIIINEKSMFFCACIGKNYKTLHITSPLFLSYESILKDLENLINNSYFKLLVNNLGIHSIILRDINNDFLKVINYSISKYSFKFDNIKGIPYATYNLQKTLRLKGTNFSNIRWHLNKFNKKNYHTESIDLFNSKINFQTELIHLIGSWRKHAIHERGFSFSDVRSDKFGVKLISALIDLQKHINKNKHHFIDPSFCLSRIIKINGRVSSFHFGFCLGMGHTTSRFAHAIGITDLSIRHLSEYAQIDFWSYISKCGYKYVNDGASWRKSLEIFKYKFRPIDIQRYYWATCLFNKDV